MVVPLAMIVIAGGSSSTPSSAAAAEPAADDFETAALTTGEMDADGKVVIRPILGEDDVLRYRDILSLQEDAAWAEADRLIARLEDRVLLGHVLAQRYLHPTAYRAQYKELAAWLAAYADHPDARRIHKLALSRKPKNAPAPTAPTVAAGLPEGAAARGLTEPRRRLGPQERRRAAEYIGRINWYLSKGWTKAAKDLLAAKEVQQLLSPLEYDRVRARLGTGYFADGHDEMALQWAGAAAARSGSYHPEAHWTAGLAAWRLGRLGEAQRHFEAATVLKDVSPWLTSAAAFWAARAHLADRRPQNYNHWLGLAAAYPHTFYGLLARHILGLPTVFRWATPDLRRSAVAALTETRGGRRALALVQIDEGARAEAELLALSVGAESELAQGILVVASLENMPALAMRLASILSPGGGYDGATYPIPQWTPDGGFRVDRALIFALIRQESAFNPRAKSWAGAHGLMQLMPGTAGFVAGDPRYKGAKRAHLFEPALNLELGQKYIEMLLEDASVKGDLVQLAVAWNGGPGNLNKWWRKTNHLNDPLLFIESIPARETRNFVERVLANLWIYRNRLGQPAPSLDALAAGQPPVYTALDQAPLKVAGDGKNRR